MYSNSLITTRKRLLIVILSIVFFFLSLSVRLFFVQIIDGENLSVKASEQWYRDLPLKAQRGTIFDKNNTVIVENKTVYTVYVRPAAVENAPKVAKILADSLELKITAI